MAMLFCPFILLSVEQYDSFKDNMTSKLFPFTFLFNVAAGLTVHNDVIAFSATETTLLSQWLMF